MSVREWSQSEVEYGRKVLDSGLEGARSGREAFLNGRPLTPFLSESVRKALRPAAVGACLGLLASCPGSRRRPAGRKLLLGLLGGVIGFGAGMVWENRRLTACVVSGALGSIERVRDEHWLEKHPIDYA
jgi:hypothetical protein